MSSTFNVGNTVSLPKTPLNSNITVTVGAGGQFSTINDALEYITSTYTAPEFDENNVYSATIELQTGFTIQEQLLIQNLDLSWIILTSVDAQVPVQRSSQTQNYAGAYGFIMAVNSSAPKFGLTLNYDTSGTSTSRIGLFLYDNSTCEILSGSGVIGAYTGILTVYNSHCIGSYVTVQDCESYGVHCYTNSNMEINNLTTTNCSNGVVVQENSNFFGNYLTSSNHTQHGIISNQNSSVITNACLVENTLNYGIYAFNNSKIYAQFSSAISCSTGYVALYNSDISAPNSLAGGNINHGFLAENSRISANSSQASHNGINGVYAVNNGTIEFSDTTPAGGGGSNGSFQYEVNDGSQIYIGVSSPFGASIALNQYIDGVGTITN